MTIRTTFTLILSAAFVVAMTAMALISYSILSSNAKQEIRERSRLMMDAAMAMRSYTINNIKPLVSPTSGDAFHPETVPAFAAMRAFELLRKDHGDKKDGDHADYANYTYREAALNPTNQSDRAVDWEHDIISHFRNFPEEKEITGERATPSGDVTYIARPIQIKVASCLDCHSEPDRAPAALRSQYGTSNGFGWKMDEVIGAQIVAVPTSESIKRARDTFGIFMASMAAAAILVVVILNFALRMMVVTPIVRLSALCDQVSTGDFSAADPQTSGDDEISSLGRSFVRMKISLQKALRMLGG
jgi:protein-histidine pros-kinase